MAEAKFTIRASDKTKSAFKSVNANMKRISSKVLSLKTAIVGLAGVGGLGALVVASANSADALAKNADKLRVTTEALSGLHLATKLYTSAGANAMNEALTKSIKRLGEFNATGGGAAAVWLKKLNLDTQELATLAPDQLFARYAESVRGLNDRGQQMAAVSALMGDESRQLIGIIDAGSVAIEESTQKSIAWGQAISRVDAAKIEAANDAFTEVQEVIKGLGTTIAVNLSPYIQAAGKQFTTAATASRGWKDETLSGVELVITGVGYVADVFRGLHVVIKGVEIVFAAFAAGLYDSLASIENQFRYVANLIPGINIAPISGLTVVAAEAAKRVAELKQEFGELVEQPMPSENVTAYLEEVKKISRETAEEVAKVAGGKTGSEGAATGGGEQATAEMQKQQDMMAQKLEQVNQFLMSKAELENQAYENRLFIVEENFQNQLIGETQRKEILQNLELKHQSKILAIEESAAQKKLQMDSMLASQRMSVAKGITGNMAQLMSSSSKKEFEVGKKFAQANALIKGYEAVTSSYAAGAKIGGPYLGAAYAATAAYATKIQLDNIRNAQFGGGGGISVGGGNVSTGSGFNGGAPNQPALESQSKQPSGGVTTITLVGNSNSQFSGEQLDGLFDQMEDAMERGDRVLFSRNSRQALELS